MVELHQAGSATKGVTPSSLLNITIYNCIFNCEDETSQILKGMDINDLAEIVILRYDH